MPCTGFIFQFSFVFLQQIFLLFCLLKDTLYGKNLMFLNDVKFSNFYYYFEYILPKEDG